MTHTLNFIFDVKRNSELKESLIRNLAEHNESTMHLKDFLLQFDFEKGIVHISCNNPEYPFIYKCPELCWTILELKEFVEMVCN